MYKKRRWIGIGMVAMAVVLIGFHATFLAPPRSAVPAAALPLEGKIIVLDAGHGGFDAGASIGSGENALIEKEINLDVVLFLKSYLEESGAQAVLTREGDESTEDANTKGKSAKKSDLENRKKLGAEHNADAFVSVHMNRFSQAEVHGAQVFYGEKPENGQKLGESIRRGFAEVLGEESIRTTKKADGIYILTDTKIPSVIVECGFLSNPEEAELLRKQDYRKKLAYAIYMGLIHFFEA